MFEKKGSRGNFYLHHFGKIKAVACHVLRQYSQSVESHDQMSEKEIL